MEEEPAAAPRMRLWRAQWGSFEPGQLSDAAGNLWQIPDKSAAPVDVTDGTGTSRGEWLRPCIMINPAKTLMGVKIANRVSGSKHLIDG